MRKALGYDLVFQGMKIDTDGKDHAIIAVGSRERNFTANAKFYWSEYNQGYMKKPHIERFWNRDVYISPLEMVRLTPLRTGLPSKDLWTSWRITSGGATSMGARLPPVRAPETAIREGATVHREISARP
jgi:hypothetical protein